MAQAHIKADLIRKMKQFAGDQHISNYISQDLQENLAYRKKIVSNPYSGGAIENNKIIEFDKMTLNAVNQGKPPT